MQVRAIERGFYDGAMVQPGAVFEMPKATRDKLPRWVQPADVPWSAKPAPQPFDTRPLDVQDAAALKNGYR